MGWPRCDKLHLVHFCLYTLTWRLPDASAPKPEERRPRRPRPIGGLDALDNRLAQFFGDHWFTPVPGVGLPSRSRSGRVRRSPYSEMSEVHAIAADPARQIL
jgi:hypothetical protein